MDRPGFQSHKPRHNQKQSQSLQQFFSSDQSQDAQIEHLVYRLTNTSPSPGIGRQLLSNIAYYIPIIKNEPQLVSVISGLINSPVFFTQINIAPIMPGIINFQEAYMIVEIIQHVVERKILVSCPTISLTTFYNLILTTINVKDRSPQNMLKQTLILTGMLSARDTLQGYLDPESALFFNKFDKLALESLVENLNFIMALNSDDRQIYEVKALSLLCFANVFPVLESVPYGDGLKKRSLRGPIAIFALNLVYNSSLGFNGGDALRIYNDDKNAVHSLLLHQPVLRIFNKMSLVVDSALYESGVQNDFESLGISLQIMLTFSKRIHDIAFENSRKFNVEFMASYWDLLKQIVFSTVIIFQSVVNLSLESRCLSQSSYSFFPRFITNWYQKDMELQRSHFADFAETILKTLFYYHFIIDKIGTGGFSAYKDIYSTSIGIINTSTIAMPDAPPSSAESLSDFFISQIQFSDLIRDPSARSKVLFLLGYWESLVSICTSKYYDKVINPVVTEFLTKPYRTIDFQNVGGTRSILENCHSVKLASLKLEKLAESNCNYVVDYMGVVLHQFPIVLSYNQLVVATSEIGGLVHGDGTLGRHDPQLQEIILNKIYARILHESPGRAIIDAVKPEAGNIGTTSKEMPPTTRSAVITAFISTVPYIETSVMLYWLQKLHVQIVKCQGGVEREYCEKKLWEVISNDLGLVKADVAITWWYNCVIGRKSHI
ncbi:hypothetical protein DASC09_056260 [Saccharomycopsis crataegensis]|uniref:Uncharacterized protein n=1 Tax=Saccharomycopsis crataegensis TaxID=43959 RepID=A0AAV5QV37_9ASCO|nr:hypothetical protein DASC09_056260 [Saccharomycopsis crataegensis]